MAWCDVALGGQLQDLDQCHLRVRLHSCMTSLGCDDSVKVGIMAGKKNLFHIYEALIRKSAGEVEGVYGLPYFICSNNLAMFAFWFFITKFESSVKGTALAERRARWT